DIAARQRQPDAVIGARRRIRQSQRAAAGGHARGCGSSRRRCAGFRWRGCPGGRRRAGAGIGNRQCIGGGWLVHARWHFQRPLLLRGLVGWFLVPERIVGLDGLATRQRDRGEQQQRQRESFHGRIVHDQGVATPARGSKI